MNTAMSSTFVSSDGDGYELQMGRWSRRLAPLFIDFAGIEPDENTLDVGCGTGNLSFALAQRRGVGAVCGIDISATYVERAVRHNSDPRIAFKIADACALPFPDASFDHALSMLVLQFIPRPEVAAREMRRVTRPGGTIAAATWDTRGGFVAQRMIFDTAAVLDSEGGARRAGSCTRPMTRPGELAQVWRDAGLANVVQDMITIRMDFSSFADFWAPCGGKDGPIADYVGTLDDAMKRRLREAVARAYCDGELDGARSYAATAWVVKGQVPA